MWFINQSINDVSRNRSRIRDQNTVMQSLNSNQIGREFTLLEIRESNIRKNQAFIQGLTTVSGSEVMSPAVITRCGSEPQVESDMSVLNKKDILSDVMIKFPYRSKEIQAIAEYILSKCKTCYPLVIYGPDGCGKSNICTEMLCRFAGLSCVFIKCSSFVSARELIDHIFASLLRASRRILPTEVIAIHDFTSSRSVSFDEFTCKLQTLFKELSKNCTNVNIGDSPMVIYLEDIHHVETYSRGLANSLLKLAEVFHLIPL